MIKNSERKELKVSISILSALVIFAGGWVNNVTENEWKIKHLDTIRLHCNAPNRYQIINIVNLVIMLHHDDLMINVQ